MHFHFNKVREDDFINLVLGGNYLFNNSWSVLPEISYSDNESTLELNTYDRIRVIVTARKEF